MIDKFKGVPAFWMTVLATGVCGTMKEAAAGFCWAVSVVTSGIYILSNEKISYKFFLREGDSSYILIPIF